MRKLRSDCPCCATPCAGPFHVVERVPVNSVLALSSRQEALEFPTGALALGFCRECGFIWNMAFDPELLEYSERYDPTQAFSATFNAWHRQLAEDVVERFQLRGKRVIEIGCGKGEFLHLLAEVGDVEGVGFDPAYEPARDDRDGEHRLEFVADFYSDAYAEVKGDAVCCKMTLEHISPARDFVDTVRRTVGDEAGTAVLFQVPDVRRILEETAFWDIYYEHCSYYSSGSLARLFHRCGFEVDDVRREYGDQYLMLAAHPRTAGSANGSLATWSAEDDRDLLAGLVDGFEARLAALVGSWRDRLSALRAEGKRTVIWGSGSKGVAFLTTCAADSDIEYVVDINTFRQGHFMAGTGQQIVAPEFLSEYAPDVVIVMNPVYREEIAADLASRGLEPLLLTA